MNKIASTNEMTAPRGLTVRMTHDDRARSAFIVGLKQRVSLKLTPRLRAAYQTRIAPAAAQRAGRALDDRNRDDRKAVIAALKGEPLYRAWAFLTYLGQGIKWELVEDVMAYELPRLQSVADSLEAAGARCKIALDPALKLPANIARTEIHRQPGGFCLETHPRDIGAGARYNFGASMGPSAAMGRKGFRAGRSAGDFVAETLRTRYPGFAPRRILELGCGTGRNTPSYTRQFPDAEVIAVDCAAGLLRWARAFAEERGAAIDFRQMDVAALDFPDGGFDLVVSHILGHETTSQNLRKMIAEAWRVLAPGGVMFHADVAIQPGHIDLFDQALNDWQVRHNGEPFWMGWADADVPALLREAGVPDADAFTEYWSAPERGGEWYCYGARKAAAQP